MLAAALCVMLTGAAPAPAVGQEIGPLMDRLERLERDIRTLNIQLSRGASEAGAAPAPAGGGTADPGLTRLGQRLDSLEQDLRGATGSIEELGHQINQMSQRLEKLVGDVDYRLNTLETRAGIAGAPAAPPAAQAGQNVAPAPATAPGAEAVPPAGRATAAPGAPTQPGSLGTVSAKAVETVRANRQASAVQAAPVAPPAPAAQAPAAKAVAAPAPVAAAPAAALPSGTVRERYTYALNLLRQTNYDQAEIALAEFVKAHGDDPLAGNARYWLGETYYVRADYEQAAQSFFAGYQSKPDGAKAPDMLLKLGMSLAQLKKKTEACATFDKLAADFPAASARISSAIDRERKRAGCK